MRMTCHQTAIEGLEAKKTRLFEEIIWHKNKIKERKKEITEIDKDIEHERDGM